MAKGKRPRGQKTRPQHAVAPPPRPAASAPAPAAPSGRPPALWGLHPVRAALANPRRRIAACWATRPAQAALAGSLAAAHNRGADFAIVTVTGAQLAARLPESAVHQGVALAAEPLPRPSLETVLAAAPGGPLVVLDRVTDPHNVGAILRSCAVFGAAALVTTERHAPPESGALARAAAGALDIVPWVRVANLARALEAMGTAGRWIAGLDGAAATAIGSAGLDSGRAALVLGAEGTGLRRLTKEKCDVLVRIPMGEAGPGASGSPVGSLNVSNAAAVALYEICRNRPDGGA